MRTDGVPRSRSFDHIDPFRPTSLARFVGPFPNSSMTPPASRTAKSPSPLDADQKVASSYEAALEELEQLVAQLDAGQLPLDQLLSRYQRGAELLAFCRSKLDAVENQIQVLEGGELKTWTAD